MKIIIQKQILRAILFSSLLLPLSVLADKPIMFDASQLSGPPTRIGGGARGSNDSTAKIQLAVLAPDKTAFTNSASPTLYWYISAPISQEVEFALRLGTDDLVEKKLGKVSAKGIQAIHLADLGIKLDPSKKYTWTVTLVSAGEDHSGDLLASATIEQRPGTQVLKDAADMAQAGYWYDALDLLIKEKSTQQVNELLKQGGITLN